MKSVELWNEKIQKPTDSQSTMTNQVFSCTFLQDGHILIAVVADAILVYEGLTGELQAKPIRGAHKDTITCIAGSKDGKRFATSSLDRSVVIWKYRKIKFKLYKSLNNRYNPNATPKISAELKYSHQDSVYCLGFNPLSHQIFSGGGSDYALWTPDVATIEKQKFKDKIICCAWSADGQSLAFGTMGGLLLLTDRRVQEFIEIQRGAPLWCMQWTPITQDFQDSILAVGCWDKTIIYYNNTGQSQGQEKVLDFDPLSISFYPNGEFYAISGNNNKVQLFTREGGFLIDCCQAKDWIWSTHFRPGSMVLACATNDGEIFVHQLTSLAVNSLWQERFVTRDQLTDVLITNMLTNQKVRIKCRELVRKVSIYRDKVAVMLGERILIYVSVMLDENVNMKYKLFKKFFKKLQCTHFCLCASNVLVSNQNKLFSYTFNGDLDHQWTFESSITVMVACGGASKRDLVLVGLKNGSVLKVFLDNSFPVSVFKLQVPIRRLDISMNKKKAAIVDDNKNLSVIDLTTKEVIFSEMGVDGVGFNCDFEEIIAYSGKGLLFVKCSNHPPLNQKINGDVIGFKGCKLFLLNENTLQTIDIQFTTSITKYIEKKDFDNAFKLSNLGSTESDIKMLGIEALLSQQFTLAKKCFMKIKDLPFIDLTIKYEGKKLEPPQDALLAAETLAYQQKFQDAGNLLIKAGLPDKAVELFSELKKWDDAKTFAKRGDVQYRAPSTAGRIGTAGGRIGTAAGRVGTGYGKIIQQNSISPANEAPTPKIQINKILKEQAEWTKETGDWKGAADLFASCGEYRKAIELYGNNKHVEGLVDVCRLIDKTDNAENIAICAQYFRKLKHHGGAKEAYLKLNDIKSLMTLNIEFELWEEVFAIARSNRDLLEMAKLPYAEYLLKHDRYEEALRAFKAAGRYDLTTKMMKEMSANYVEEHRFEEASQLFQQIAQDALQLVENYIRPSPVDQQRIRTYKEYQDIAEIYYAYQRVHNFIEEPFQPVSGDAYLHQIFNVCRFIISKNVNRSLFGVNISYVYYALAKVARNLECYKTARLCYDKLSHYRVPNEWHEEIDLSNLLIRSKPFIDQDLLMPVCNRCMTQNSVVGSQEICASCYHPLISSLISFNILPLIEFKVDPKLTHKQVVEILNRDKTESKPIKINNKQSQNDGWSEQNEGNKQVLRFNENQVDQSTPFFDKLNEIIEMQHTQSEYIPMILNEQLLSTLQPEEVVWVNLQHICSTIEIRYYKNIVPELPLHICKNCGKIYLLDEYEFEYLKLHKCPFCKHDDKGITKEKDVFDI